MKKDIYIVDAFTDKLYAGNPAGVVLDADDLDDVKMQKIAKELNLSETAFVLSSKSNNYDLEVRFFTPAEEVDLCGHATIATFYLLRELGVLDSKRNKFIQKTKAGLLDIYFDSENVIMRQSSPKEIDKKIEISTLADVMNIAESEIGTELCIDSEKAIKLMPEIWTTGLQDILLPMKSIETLNNMKPDMEALAELSKTLDVVGVHAFFLDIDKSGKKINRVVCRNFAPAYDIPEESATGTSNGALGGYLSDKGYEGGEFSFVSHQGDGMGRPSRIFVKINSNPTEVWVGGKAVRIMSGKIEC